MMMKTANLFKILILSIFVSCAIFSCNKDDDNVISLPSVENNVARIIFPRENPYLIDIIGGEGAYSVNSDNDQVVDVVINEKQLILTPLSIGNAVITIKDKSNHSFILNIEISYLEYSYAVIGCNAFVKGDNLTTEQLEEIEAKALASIPVQIDGGYRFVYTDEKRSEGKVYIYAEKLGDKYEKGTFKHSRVNIEGSINNDKYEITTEKGVRSFMLLPYNNSMSKSNNQIIPYQLCEDLTEEYKPTFENLEQVYTSQVLKFKLK